MSEARLLDKYSVGKTLGEGAFGVVANCTERATGKEFAVKMVDKVETPVDAIKKEAQLLQDMNHKNVVKCHGVFYERCFVCIVMDKFAGGDLVEGLQWHLKEIGQIPCHQSVHVAHQMGASIQYLHSQKVMHRDVKGDNYLMDRKNMTEPECVVVLTDFGTCCQFKEGDRHSSGVGTKIFWSPEFFDKKYGPKVDVWAIGVIMYGLVSGRFPFRDEKDIRNKVIKIGKNVHPTCIDFINVLLCKTEKDRPDSNQVMQHAWIAEITKKAEAAKMAEQAVAEPEDKPKALDPAKTIRRDQANDGVHDRRQELINRMDREKKAREGETKKQQAPSAAHLKEKCFAINDKTTPGAKLKYEWWSVEKVNQSGVMGDADKAKPAKMESSGSGDLKLFTEMLTEHRIDTKLYGVGEAKGVGQLEAEVRSGAARLMLDATAHKKLVRVVDIVVLRIRAENGKLLIETEEKFPDGRTRTTLRLPATKKEPHENARQTAARIVQDLMNMSSSMVVADLSNIDRYEEETESPSYPGLATVYRKEIVECTMKDPAQNKKAAEGSTWVSTDALKNQKTWSWMTKEEAEGQGVKLKCEETEAISALVTAAIGMEEDALASYLANAGVDITKFGVDGSKTMKEFSAELIKGEATLMQDEKRVTRVVDVVVLVVTKPGTGEILMQTEQILPDKSTVPLNRLPGAKRRPDENQFLSARRVLRRQLGIDENAVKFNENVEFVEEEKSAKSYPGLVTVYRKRLIRAEVLP